MKVNKFFTSVFLSFFLLVFISCGNMLNEKFPENTASLSTDLGVTYTGSSSGGSSGSNRIEKYSDGTYKFNSSGSYWISNNNGINSSTATSTWRITVTSSCSLTIYYDVSSESGCDKFTLSLNNTNIVTDVSGTVNSSVTRTLAVGQHTLIARYVKNSSNSSGSDNVKLRFDLTTGSSSSSTPSLGDFVLVSGGSFQMGNSSYSSEAPVHSVTVSSFYMCNHEVTQSEFETIMGTNPSQYKGSSYPPASGEVQNNRPVENVSWYAAIAYCNKRSIAEDLTPCYSVSGVTNWSSLSYSSIPTSSNTNWDNAICNWNATGYRLPTEAEWEYAARGGSSSYTYTYSGSSTVENVAWYTSNSASKTHEVKKKTANSLGLYDMSGNVWEWCWDLYGTYSSGSVSNPRGPSSGSEHVLRGGSWFDGSSDCRVFSRHGRTPNHTYNSNGFRVVRLGNSSSAGSGGTGTGSTSYTISYSSSRGSTPSSITKTYGQTLTSSDLPTLTSSGYTFVGWYTSSSYTESSRVNTGYTVTSSVTLYAKWQAFSSSIQKYSDGTYKFNLSGSYWISNNNGVHNSSATSTWKITVNGSCTLTIYYDVSSEQNYDKLNLSVDGTSVLSNISGTANSYVSRTLTSGQHTVIATYSKDGTQSSGDDRARVRFVISY